MMFINNLNMYEKIKSRKNGVIQKHYLTKMMEHYFNVPVHQDFDVQEKN